MEKNITKLLVKHPVVLLEDISKISLIHSPAGITTTPKLHPPPASVTAHLREIHDKKAGNPCERLLFTSISTLFEEEKILRDIDSVVLSSVSEADFMKPGEFYAYLWIKSFAEPRTLIPKSYF